MHRGQILKWVNGYFVCKNTLVAREGGICIRSRILARIGGEQCAGGRIKAADILQIHSYGMVCVYIHAVLMSKGECVIVNNTKSTIVATNGHDRHRYFHNGRNSGNHVEIYVIVEETIFHITGAGRVTDDVERYGIPYDYHIVGHYHPEIASPREVVLGEGGQ